MPELQICTNLSSKSFTYFSFLCQAFMERQFFAKLSRADTERHSIKAAKPSQIKLANARQPIDADRNTQILKESP